MKRFMVLLGAFLLIVTFSSGASALTFTPTPYTDLRDLDHGNYYTWGIDVMSQIPKDHTITGATLSFENIRNWDDKAYDLYVHLLNNVSKGFKQYSDANDATAHDNFNDALWQGNEIDLAHWKGRVELSASSVQALGLSTAIMTKLNPVMLKEFVDITELGASVKAALGTSDYNKYWTKIKNCVVRVGEGPNNTSIPFTLNTTTPSTGANISYAFTAEQLVTLNNYVKDGNFGLGFDPDCHFWNDGVKLTLETAAVADVPEPGTIILLLGGLLGLLGIRRRQAHKK